MFMHQGKLRGLPYLCLLSSVTFLSLFLGCASSSAPISSPGKVGEIKLPGTASQFVIGSQGELKNGVQISSADEKLIIGIPAGTVILDKDGQPIQSLSILVDSGTVPNPTDSRIIGSVYDCQPMGASFSYPLRLTLSYDSAKLPIGTSVGDLYIAGLDGDKWEALSYKQRDPAKPLITTQIGRFSKYAVMAPIKADSASTAVQITMPTPTPSSSPSPAASPTPKEVLSTPVTPTPAATATANPGVRVDVLYFHPSQRCSTCLYFEERIRYVIDTHFKDEVSRGTLTFKDYNYLDKANAALVKKYQVVGSQLFITTAVDGTENIRNVSEIYSWGTSNKDAFHENLRQMIQKSLGGGK